ncbi:hypothetical protein [Streptosporangium lutulentum]|uniref:Secreted protein n=1 Tax=Streptosporangium lutulentum TaxID=1461250 RepID=A0ABT9QML2_9ACTN|nr:hypothetical protein [Streptosporangium lutulentum]MDP9848003.1 hypothetical protein [Streptosporangium lutulentum]
MTTPHTARIAALLLAITAALTLTAACVPVESACAATLATVATPPEPIEDGTYRDGSYEETEDAPPEPIEDGSYRDGSHEDTEQADVPPEPDEHTEDAGSC